MKGIIEETVSKKKGVGQKNMNGIQKRRTNGKKNLK